MTDLPTEIRDACAWVCERATHVSINLDAVPAYAAGLPLAEPPAPRDARIGDSAYWLTLDAINFGSGWFPTLRKRPGHSGYGTVAAALRDRFTGHGAWSPEQLASLDAAEIARTLGQDPDHELMALFARSLNDLGEHLQRHGGFDAVLASAGASAVSLATELAGWDCFGDVSAYAGRRVPFFKRAQIAAADLARAGTYQPTDLGRLTMFADNLVPHVLRLDGVLIFEPRLVARINAQQLIEHGSPEEVEIRACALHAVELLVAAARDSITAAAVDQCLWNKGSQPRYKASPRHRTRCTAY